MINFSLATTKADRDESKEFLAITMVPKEGDSVLYGMRAMLSRKSTPGNPIVQVISNLGGKREFFNVEVNKVDPANASRIEIFALCSYADKHNGGSIFGNFHSFKMHEKLVRKTDFTDLDEAAVWEEFKLEKLNWMELCEEVL
ncbi:MAG: hypothetical protein IJP31_01035 [Lachnospiraceae bacterium]|nr:hypothetical protein [Lachnospiraceae bacterium]